MAPVRTKKRKSSAPRAKESIKTPERSPIKKPMMITQAQKQALIDNLQLEITERARKLRAQYALQAQSLRTRMEMRVNRIPTALRKANMGELYDKYMESLQAEKPKAMSKVSKSKAVGQKVPSVPAPKPELKENNTRTRGMKRKSDELDQADKENTPDPSHDIPAPKKRVNPAVATSRQVTNPSTVLSPKSSNSRTLPRSPVRPPFGAPPKSQVSRPASPLKPPSPIKTAAAAATSTLANMVGDKLRGNRPLAGAGRKASKTTAAEAKEARLVPAATRAKRGAATNATTAAPPATGNRTVSATSNVSGTSGTSTGTTIVKRAGRAAAPKTAAPRAAVAKKEVGVSAAGKKVAPAKTKVEAPPAGRRVLRKRA